jgi:hypothetical protein
MFRRVTKGKATSEVVHSNVRDKGVPGVKAKTIAKEIRDIPIFWWSM